MSKFGMVALALAAAGWAASAPMASAEIIYVDVKGTLAGGVDGGNVFGFGYGVNKDLTGVPFRLIWRFDTDANYPCFGSSSCADSYGGQITADLRINGFHYGFGSYYGQIIQVTPPSYCCYSLKYYAENIESYYPNEYYSNVYLQNFAPLPTYDWREIATGDITAAFGTFAINATRYAYGNFNASGISSIVVGPEIAFDPADAVPEPATWGLMILGFGLAGGALRRRSWSAPAA